jgi:hypothetical protein
MKPTRRLSTLLHILAAVVTAVIGLTAAVSGGEEVATPASPAPRRRIHAVASGRGGARAKEDRDWERGAGRRRARR